MMNWLFLVLAFSFWAVRDGQQWIGTCFIRTTKRDARIARYALMVLRASEFI